MNNLNPKVDSFLDKATKWKQEMILLRTTILECDLDEDYKWMRSLSSSCQHPGSTMSAY